MNSTAACCVICVEMFRCKERCTILERPFTVIGINFTSIAEKEKFEDIEAQVKSARLIPIPKDITCSQTCKLYAAVSCATTCCACTSLCCSSPCIAMGCSVVGCYVDRACRSKVDAKFSQYKRSTHRK